MAIESVATPNQAQETQAITEWTDDSAWKSLDGLISVGVWRRLAKVNRALYASNHIASMLVLDARGKSHAEDDPGVTYAGFGAVDVEALQVAMIELGSSAQECLEEVRDNRYGCCGKLRSAT